MRRSAAAPQRAWLPLFCMLLLLRLFSLFATAAIEDGLLNNGDFETVGEVSTGGKGEGITSLPGWTVNGTVELVESGQKQGGMILIVPQGVHAVRLGNDAEIAQGLQLEKGATYAVTFSAARTCAQLETLNVSVWPASHAVDLQTLYSVEGWDAYAWAFQAPAEAEVDGAESRLSFRNPGMEDDPTCGPIIDDIAIKKLFAPERPQDDAVVNGDFEEGPWMLPNANLGVLLPTNLDEETSALPGWMVESNRAVRYIDSYHFDVPQGKRAVELLSGKEGIISQMVETTPQKQYSLTFTVGTAGDSCQAPMAVMAFAGGPGAELPPLAHGQRDPPTCQHHVHCAGREDAHRLLQRVLQYEERRPELALRGRWWTRLAVPVLMVFF
ncbi:hypothetical protein OPV22_035185 [Ensete ventricosum]|uniref:DUF642 domain-containing protein n=1 Tax=Ensete ventricosum TaxID=4639 RepID=A0AAX5NE46_ENSVE|nr:hypothetical protein OPV22_035185 [Ensete ventricosum]